MTELNFYNEKIDEVVKIPTAWDELTRSEALMISYQLRTYKANIYEAKAAVFTSLVTIRANDQKIKLPKDMMHNVNLDDIPNALDSLEFIFRDLKQAKTKLDEIQKAQ